MHSYNMINQFYINQFYGVLVVIIIASGPFLMILRGTDSSPIEKFIYVIAQCPLLLLLVTRRYFMTRATIMTEPDIPARQERLERAKGEYRLLLVIGIPASLIAIVAWAWLVFIRQPT